MDASSLDLADHLYTRHKELAAELLQKTDQLQADITHWHTKYKEVRPNLENYIFNTDEPEAPAEKNKAAKIVRLENSPPAHTEKTVPEHEPKLISLNDEMLTPKMAREQLQKCFRFTHEGWETIIGRMAGLKEHLDTLANKEFALYDGFLYVLKVIHEQKTLAAQLPDAKAKFETFMRGMPVTLDEIATQCSISLEANFKLLESLHAVHKSVAAQIATQERLAYSLYALMNGIMKWAMACLQQQIDFSEGGEALGRVTTVRNILMDLVYKSGEVFILEQELLLLYSYSGLQLQRIMVVAQELGS